MESRVRTMDEKLALLESLPPEFWEFVELAKEHGPQLFRLLKVLLERLGSGDPPGPPISFGPDHPRAHPMGHRFTLRDTTMAHRCSGFTRE